MQCSPSVRVLSFDLFLFVSVLSFSFPPKRTSELQCSWSSCKVVSLHFTTLLNMVIGLTFAAVPLVPCESQFARGAATEPLHRTTPPAMAVGLPCKDAPVVELGLRTRIEEEEYIHACMHACIHTYIHTYIHMHAYVRTYVRMCACIYIHTHIHTYTHTYTYMCVYVYVCVYVYIYIYIHLYIHIQHTCIYIYI